MKITNLDRRRLHDRHPASVAATLSIGSNSSHPGAPIKVLEISREGLTCEIPSSQELTEGGKGFVRFLSMPDEPPVEVKIMNRSNGQTQNRLGLQFVQP